MSRTFKLNHPKLRFCLLDYDRRRSDALLTIFLTHAGNLAACFLHYSVTSSTLGLWPSVTPGKGLVVLPTIKAELAGLDGSQSSVTMYSNCALSLFTSGEKLVLL